ncbi:MAG: hypothetical protein QNK23_03085 [Crocinitomicaceae bacterium]|nr:hypothetical protein [Crocinitomicaceae bacterium]
MKSFLIADSGGTRTDWCYVNEHGEKSFFETESYHPSNWSESFWSRLEMYWNERHLPKDVRVHFFGAGCLLNQNADKLTKFFQKIGFGNSLVKSDLHAAGLALYGTGDGWAAIMGTGSVVFKWQRGEVDQIIGGKGHLLGDEGSGFYFGKLVIEAYGNNDLSEMQRELVEEIFDVHALSSLISEPSGKKAIANVAYELFKHLNEFEEYHVKNMDAFYASHLQEINCTSIAIAGSYGEAYKEVIKKSLKKKNVSVSNFVQRPIELLVEQIVVLTD